MKLRFTYRALDDLSRLRSFIAQNNPTAARRISRTLLGSIQHLVDHPQMGRRLEDQSGVREWMSGDYIVHYLSDDQVVTVLRIWHGKEQRSEA